MGWADPCCFSSRLARPATIRGPAPARSPAQGQGIAGRSWLRCRLVPQRIERQRHFALHSITQKAQQPGRLRQNPLQATISYREHVWQDQGLEAHRDQIRPMRSYFPIRNHHRRNVLLLARLMSPEPNQKTVAKWSKRASVCDLPTGPKEPRSTVLLVKEEAVIVALQALYAATSLRLPLRSAAPI